MLNLDSFHIYQIHYDEASRLMLDPGFMPLDNSENEHSDWCEYWPIRQFLMSNQLKDDHFYGFLSPKFKQKTGLGAIELKEFIKNKFSEDIDAFVVSPFFDQAVFFKNVFDQGDYWHKGLKSISQTFFERIDYAVDLDQLVNHTQNTVFCNYIIAKPRFWYKWLELGEHLFNLSEQGDDSFAKQLSSGTSHFGAQMYQFKVFIQERFASLLLATRPYKCAFYEPFKLPILMPMLGPYLNELIICDALKQSYVNTDHEAYNEAYGALIQKIIQSINSGL